jgi:hypothetical protein
VTVATSSGQWHGHGGTRGVESRVGPSHLAPLSVTVEFVPCSPLSGIQVQVSLSFLLPVAAAAPGEGYLSAPRCLQVRYR